MTYLAVHNLWQQKFRFALSVVSVALAMMLIMVLNGFLAGIYDQVTAYLDRTAADFVVAEDGVTNLLSASSILPGGAEARARSVHGTFGCASGMRAGWSARAVRRAIITAAVASANSRREPVASNSLARTVWGDSVANA